MTDCVRRGSDSISFFVKGSGPGLLVPWCNYPWSSVSLIDVLAEEFTVAVVSPCGYQPSTRLDDARRYTNDSLCRHLLAVCDHLDLEHVAVLGYSLTAAMAGWLARSSDRIRSVVAGGFPLLSDYTVIRNDARRIAAEVSLDAIRSAEIEHDFDIRAVLAFYAELADIAPGALVMQRRCPMLAFWGTQDQTIRSLGWNDDDDAQALRRAGVDTLVIDGCDHADTPIGMIRSADVIIDWLRMTTANQT